MVIIKGFNNGAFFITRSNIVKYLKLLGKLYPKDRNLSFCCP